jgi:hypothetical protein
MKRYRTERKESDSRVWWKGDEEVFQKVRFKMRGEPKVKRRKLLVSTRSLKGWSLRTGDWPKS